MRYPLVCISTALHQRIILVVTANRPRILGLEIFIREKKDVNIDNSNVE